MTQKAIPIVVSGALLGLVFDWFFYEKVPGVSVFLYTILILGFTGFFMWQFERSINKALYWLAPLTLFFAFMVFVRANPFLAFVNSCLVIYLLLLVLRLARNPKASLDQLTIPKYITLAFKTPLAVMQRALQFYLGALSNRRAPKSSVLPIVRGALISLPILFIFLALLSSADVVFRQMISGLFDYHQINSEIVWYAIRVGFIASLFIGAFALIFMTSHEPEAKMFPDGVGLKLGATESSVILGSVSVLFFMFVMIQLAYLFGGADQVASTGYTYAEYARKGFFELIAVAAISLALILTIKKTVVFRAVAQKTTFKWLSGILIAEVLVIMLSAHMRLNLYEEAYGFTTLRLLSHMFIFWLAIAFGLLLFHIISGSREQKFAFRLFVSLMGFFVVLNLINIDGFIARQNISRFNDTGKIDMYYLGNLSEDATPAIARLLDSNDERVQKSAANILYRQKEYGEPTDNWQSVNVAKERAKQVIRTNAKQVETGKDYNKYPELD